MKITVYTTTTCPYCDMLKKHLKDHGQEFDLKLIDQDDEARKEMEGESGGFLGVPFTIIEKDGQKTKIIGFDKNKINETIGISE